MPVKCRLTSTAGAAVVYHDLYRSQATRVVPVKSVSCNSSIGLDGACRNSTDWTLDWLSVIVLWPSGTSTEQCEHP